jgi:hypothetical protein
MALKVEGVVNGGVHAEKTLGGTIDEKSQVQALDRTQPGLPIRKEAPEPSGPSGASGHCFYP